MTATTAVTLLLACLVTLRPFAESTNISDSVVVAVKPKSTVQDLPLTQLQRQLQDINGAKQLLLWSGQSLRLLPSMLPTSVAVHGVWYLRDMGLAEHSPAAPAPVLDLSLCSSNQQPAFSIMQGGHCLMPATEGLTLLAMPSCMDGQHNC
jgi:hypothetical protein